eukprot:366229-Chlamydomonas_euryale.AAC.51
MSVAFMLHKQGKGSANAGHSCVRGRVTPAFVAESLLTTPTCIGASCMMRSGCWAASRCLRLCGTSSRASRTRGQRSCRHVSVLLLRWQAASHCGPWQRRAQRQQMSLLMCRHFCSGALGRCEAHVWYRSRARLQLGAQQAERAAIDAWKETSH